MLGISISVPGKFFETKFCYIIRLDGMTNHAKYIFNLLGGFGKGSNFAIFSVTVGGHYNS